MNKKNDQRRLLDDILSEEGDTSFRESLLHQSVSLARRRRRRQHLGRAAGALLVIACAGLFFWRSAPPVQSPSKSAPRPYVLVESRPLPPASVVNTEPIPDAFVVASASTETVVTTLTAQKIYHEIDERQLFALAPAPIILIRFDTNNAEVVFANPSDQERYYH